MLSKMGQKAASAALMIGALPHVAEAKIDPPPQYTYLSTLSCAECIQAGYTYVYDSGTEAATQLYSVVDNVTTATADYSGFCCELGTDGTTYDCNDGVMWAFWKKLMSGEQYGQLTTAFTLYNQTFGVKKTKELISQFNKNMTNTDALNWALAKSLTLQIDAQITSWKTTYIDTLATFTDKNVLATFVTDLGTLETQYGFFAKYIFAQKLLNAFSVYIASPSTQNLKTLFDNERDLLTTFTTLMTEVSPATVTNSATYVQQLKDIFTLLYKDIKTADTSTGATTFTTNETTTNNSLKNIITSNAYQLIIDTKTTLTTSKTALTAASSRYAPAYKLELAEGFSHPTVSNIITAIANDKGTKKSSELFANRDLALVACPNLKKVCNTRLIELAKVGDSGTFTATNPTKADSCSTMVKTTCGYPDVTISSTSLPAKWALTLFEWQEGSKKVPAKLQDKTKGNPLYPDFDQVFPWVGAWEAEEEGFVPFYGSTTTAVNFQDSGLTLQFPQRVPIQKVIDMVDEYKEGVDAYLAEIVKYDAEVATFDAANKVVKDQITAAQTVKETRGSFDCFFGCDPVVIGTAPKPPKKPLMPDQYTYFTIDKLTVKKALGDWASGSLKLATGTKSFGVFGSSAAGKLAYSQTLDTSVTELKDGKNVTTDTCKTKYSIISLYPELGNTDTGTGTLSITVSSQLPAQKNVTPPAYPEQPKLTTRPVNQAAINQLLTELNGSMMINMAAAAASATLIGMTLY